MIREHPFDRYSLIRLAEEQYDPSLVMIDSHRISSIPWPADSSSPMTLQLAESVAANEKSAVSFLLAITSINYRFWLPSRRLGDRRSIPDRSSPSGSMLTNLQFFSGTCRIGMVDWRSLARY